MNKKMLLFTLALPFIVCQSAEAQTGSRLVAKADWVNNGATFNPLDSTSYTYSGTRGGDLTHTLNYDNATTFSYLGDTAYSNGNMYIQTFDANNNVLSYISEYWSGTGWVLGSKNLYTYDSTNKKTSMIAQSWSGTTWTPVSKDVYSYVGSNLVEDQFQVWNSLTGTFSTASQKNYYYDPVTGKKTNQTNINIVSGSPVNVSEYNYGYTTAGQLQTTTFLTWSGAAWIPSTMYTSTFDTTGNVINYLYQTYNSATTTWVNKTLHVYSGFTSTHAPMTDILQTWDTAAGGSWADSMEFMYTYNSYNQMTNSIGMSYNIVGTFEFALGNPMSNYYYANYSLTNVGVANVTKNNEEVNLYPVPASTSMHIDVNWHVAQAATAVIYDMQGHVVAQWDTPNGTQFSTVISVNNLAAGNYVLKIIGTESTVVKQFAVSH